MPINFKKYRVLLASPSDVQEERMSMEGVINELNHAFQSKSVEIELVKWETHSHPSFGRDAQDVINQQINDAYDIFVGVMWSRFGSPTKRAGSGTEEEFNRAYKRYLESPNSIKIMFYFKNKAIPFDSIEPDQIQKIKDFKSELGEKGSLYWEYSDISEFERNLRKHLLSAVEELESKHDFIDVSGGADLDDIEDEDLGLYDYLEISEESFSSLQEIMDSMTNIVEEVGVKMSQRSEEINNYTSNGNMNNRSTIQYVDKAAQDMDNFVQQMNAEIPSYKQYLSTGLDAFINLMKVYKDWQGENAEYNQTISELRSLRQSMDTSKNEILLFKNEIIRLPNLTRKFNKAKKGSIKALNKIIREMELGCNQIDQFDLSTKSN